jgi:hypothetical protein
MAIGLDSAYSEQYKNSVIRGYKYGLGRVNAGALAIPLQDNLQRSSPLLNIIHDLAFSSFPQFFFIGAQLVALALLMATLLGWRHYRQRVQKAYTKLIKEMNYRYTDAMAEHCGKQFVQSAEFMLGMPYWLSASPLGSMTQPRVNPRLSDVLLCGLYHCMPGVGLYMIGWYGYISVRYLFRPENARLAWLR